MTSCIGGLFMSFFSNVRNLVAVIAVSAVGFSSASFAEHACLSQVSNQDLLTELSSRLNTHGGGHGGAEVEVTLVCNSYQLQIELVSLSGNGGPTNKSVNFSDSTRCSNFIAGFGSRTLTKSRIIGVCNSYQMLRYILKTDATIQDLPAINYNTSTECDEAAKRL
jgi:hypothetical protein